MTEAANKPLIALASKSPRRRLLLEQINLAFIVVDVAIDETPTRHEAAADYVERMALEKAHAALAGGATQGLPVLAADTSVVLNGEILGKPADAAQAMQMLLALSGCSHEVLTAMAIATATGIHTGISRSTVRFRELDKARIRAYVQSGEPLDKAGSYAIQGLAASFIERLEGSYSGVMGLDLFETTKLLNAVGISILPPGTQMT